MNSRIQYLLQQYENNNCSREEMEELFYYIRTSKDVNASIKSWVNKKYREIRDNLPSFAYVNDQGELVTDHGSAGLFEGQEPSGRRNRIRRYALLVGAFVIILGLVWAGFTYFRASEPKALEKERSIIQKRTGNGENKYLLLPDSSQVWLNVGSVLEFYDDFVENRSIRLTGEAFIKTRAGVAPFQVSAANITLQTNAASSYNIKAYEDENEIIVSVSQGKLSVDRAGIRINELSPGRQTNLGRADKSVTEKSVSVEKMAAWQWGEYIYDYAMVEDIVSDLKRIFNAKIIILDPEKKHQKIYVSLRREMGIEDCLASVARLTNMEVNLVDDEYMLGDLTPAP